MQATPRADLSPAQEADHIRRRQVIWERRNGPSKAVGGRASAVAQGKDVANEDSSLASFTAETARATGRAASGIRQASARARELGDDIGSAAR